MGQRIVQVPQGFGTLNDAVDGDTTATGERIDLDTIYELERDGFYLLNGTIENRFPLTIVAADGDGERPRIIPGVVEGGESTRPFRPRDDLFLQGVYVTAMDEFGGMNTNMIRITGDGINVRIDDCHLDHDGQAAFRFDSNDISVHVTNSIISNQGRTPDPNNGRVFDTRGNQTRAVISRNNTYYNVTSRILRVAGGTVEYAEFTNNTIVNIGQWGIPFESSAHAVLKDNVFINGTYYGAAPPGEDEELRAVVSIDPVEDQIIEISNNNFWSDPSLPAVYPEGWVEAPALDTQLQEAASAQGANIISENVPFADGVESPVAIAQAFHQDPDGAQPPWDEGPHDFTYPETAQSYTAASDGGPLGDRSWFGVTVSRESDAEIASTFELNGNYPNPFNPSTTITYVLHQGSNVRIEVFNAIGQRVDDIEIGMVEAGSHEFRFDAGELPSGLYLVRMHADNRTQTHRMTLVK